MYNEEEIKESLEFCQDIDIYYENKRELYSYEGNRKQKRFLKKEDKKKDLEVNFSENSSFMSSYSILGEKNIYEENKEAFETIGMFQRVCHNIGTFFVILFLSYGISSFLNNYCIWQTVVDGISMEPALENGDRVIVDKWTYHFQEPKRFDIVVFPQDIDVYYVKRIIGLPGETVEIKNGKIYIDGIVLVENYANEAMEEEYSMGEVVLLEDEYFVLGDNRNHSIDSREYSVGAVKRKYIVGKAKVILYPFENIKIFK